MLQVEYLNDNTSKYKQELYKVILNAGQKKKKPFV